MNPAPFLQSYLVLIRIQACQLGIWWSTCMRTTPMLSPGSRPRAESRRVHGYGGRSALPRLVPRSRARSVQQRRRTDGEALVQAPAGSLKGRLGVVPEQGPIEDRPYFAAGDKALQPPFGATAASRVGQNAKSEAICHASNVPSARCGPSDDVGEEQEPGGQGPIDARTVLVPEQGVADRHDEED